MAKLLKLGIVLLAALAIFALPAYAITSAKIVDGSGNIVSLKYDNVSSSYVDTSVNNNSYLSVCGVTANNYVGYVYKANNSYVQISSGIGGPFGNLLRILSVNGSGCAKVDLDFSTSAAYYPGIPTVVYSTDNTLSTDDDFTQLSQSDGWLKGSFGMIYKAAGSDLNVSVRYVYDDSGNAITGVKPYIALGLKDGSGNVVNSSIVQPNQYVIFQKPSNFSFLVNGIDINQTMCSLGQTLCQDGTCSANCTATDSGAAGCIGSPDSSCDVGEGCACSDCYGQQDSCGSGLVCDRQSQTCGNYDCGNGVCDTARGENSANCPADCATLGPSGAAFGNLTVSEWPCTWTSTYDGSATSAQPIKLSYYHECTPLREVDISFSKLVIGVRIETYGNESVINLTSRPIGTTFGYFKFEHNIPEASFGGVLIQYKVPKIALTAKGFAPEDISLQKLTDSGWVKLSTKFVSEDTDNFFFESTTSSLSLFAIVAEKVIPSVVPTKPAENVTTTPVAGTKFQFPVLFVTLFILMIIIMTLGLRYSAHRARTTTVPAYKTPKIPPIRIPEMPSMPKFSVSRAQLPAALVNLQERIERIKQEAEITTGKLEAKQKSQESVVLEEPKAKKPKKTPKIHKKRAKHISKKAFEDIEKALK